ncbi:MAG: hypothetical protein GY946_19015, partial [bacterium]|nr:hypothetical protein [bacterium]
MKLQLLLVILCIFTPVLADADPERVEISTIQALWDGGARDSALALIGTEMAVARAETDSSRLAALLLKEGAYHAAFGNYGHCEGVMAESVALAEALADSTVLIAALRWYGVSVSSLGRGEEGAALYNRVLTLARILDDRPHEGWAQIGLSWYAWKHGDGDLALKGYHQAVDCFSGTEDLTGTLWALSGLARVQSGLGDYEAALESYHLGRTLARAGGRLMAEANSLNDIGSMEFFLGMTDRALEHFRSSLAIQSGGEISRQQIYPLFNIAICLNTQGRTREARETLTGAMATCAEQGYKDLEASAIIKLAEILMNQGQLNEAELRFREALGPDREPRLANRITAQIGLSEVLKRQDRDEAAQAELEKASDLLATTTLTWQRLRVMGHFGLLQTRLGRHRIALDSHLDLAEQAEEHGVIEFRFRALAHAAQNCVALAMPDSALLLYEEAASTWKSVRRLLLDPDWRERRGSDGQMIYTDLAALMISRGETAA